MTARKILAPVAGTLIAGFFTISAMANPRIIGMTSAQSGVSVDNSSVAGNATIFDGSIVQSSGYSRLQLNNGAKLSLGAGSRVRVFADRVSVEAGLAEVQTSGKYEIEARTLRITTSNGSSVARVKLDGENTVLVAAVNAPVNVVNRDGFLVASVRPGMPLSFLPQAAGTAFDGTGCVLQKSGVAILAEPGGKVSELRGADVRKAVGNTVNVIGTINQGATPGGGASQVVTVSSSKITSTGGCSDTAAKLGATTAAAGLAAAATTGAATAAAAGAAVAAGTGISGAMIGVIVGGVAAASVGGAAAAGAFSRTSP